MLPRELRHALRLLAVLTAAGRTDGARIAVRELAIRAGVPPPFAGKIATALGRAGLLVSRRGRNGGLALAPGAGRETVAEVARHLGARVRTDCILGVDCTPTSPCALTTCAPARAALEALLATPLAALDEPTRGPAATTEASQHSSFGHLDDELL